MDASHHELKPGPGALPAILKHLKSLSKVRAVDQGGRGCVEGEHLLWESVEGGKEGLRGESGRKGTNRERCDGSGLQGNRQTTALRLGDEAERVGAVAVCLRCLGHTTERWNQFWAKVDRSGYPVAA